MTMPRVRRRAKRRKAGYTDRHLAHLLKGHGFFDDFGHDGPNSRCDWGAMRQAWEELRDDLLPAWIAENPGTRPYAWWAFDAPEPRRCLSGPGRSILREPDAPSWAKRLSFGVPFVLSGEDFKNPSEYESESAYLRRLGLMTDEERRLVETRSRDPIRYNCCETRRIGRGNRDQAARPSGIGIRLPQRL